MTLSPQRPSNARKLTFENQINLKDSIIHAIFLFEADTRLQMHTSIKV